MAMWMAAGTNPKKSPWVSVALHSEKDKVLLKALKMLGHKVYGE